MTQPISDVAGISLRLITAVLGVHCSTAADVETTPEAENLQAVRAELDDLGEHLAVELMLAEIAAAVVEAVGRAENRDPLQIWQKAMVGLARDDVDE